MSDLCGNDGRLHFTCSRLSLIALARLGGWPLLATAGAEEVLIPRLLPERQVIDDGVVAVVACGEAVSVNDLE